MHPLVSSDEVVQVRAEQRGAGGKIRIAILDSGYDKSSYYFHSPARKARIIEYKSWVDDASSSQHNSTAGAGPQDCNGHGTHATALLLSIADRADIYVARIAKSSEGLASAITKVAEVCYPPALV